MPRSLCHDEGFEGESIFSSLLGAVCGIWERMDTTTVARPLSYEDERGKPTPSFNHAVIQAKLIGEFLRNPSFTIASELTLNINGTPFTPDLSVYPRRPLNLRRDVSRSPEPPLLVVEIFSPQQGTQEVMDKVENYFAFGVK